MIIQGPHGLNIGSQVSGVFAVKDAIFLQMESGQDGAMARGDWVCLDVTDNAAVAGINQNTRGLRVVQTTIATNVLVVGCLETPFPAQPAGFAAANRVTPILMVQTFGYHSAGNVQDSAANAPPRLLTTQTVAGVAVALNPATIAAVSCPAICGITLVITINGTQRQDVWVKTM